jgi:micrococcal nuclease
MPQKSTNKLLMHFMCFVLVCGFVLVCKPCGVVQAASLFGTVIEINSGDVITVFNLNRRVRVRILGIDAPEMNQAFGDVAMKHLSDLVFKKSVLVEYSGIGADSSLSGRVLLGNADIGSQMIRDGAAWFDPNNQNRLSETDREVYQQSELAARNEKRGLWQEENPTPPWNFVRLEKLAKNTSAVPSSIVPTTPKRNDRPIAELTNLSLLTARTQTAAPRPTPSESDMAWASAEPIRGDWRQLRPAGENFSVLVPAGGKQMDLPTAAGDRMVETHVYMARDGWSIFALMWITGPTLGETDKLAIDQTLTGFMRGVGEGYQYRGKTVGGPSQFICELQNPKSISMNGYTGSEFNLTSCTIPARARAFTRVVDDQRQMYVAVVFYMEEDDNVMRFIKSFTVGPAQTSKRPSN